MSMILPNLLPVIIVAALIIVAPLWLLQNGMIKSSDFWSPSSLRLSVLIVGAIQLLVGITVIPDICTC